MVTGAASARAARRHVKALERIQSVQDAVSAQQAAITQVEVRVRALENNASRQDARFDGLKQSLDEVKEAQRETNTLLRELARGVTK